MASENHNESMPPSPERQVLGLPEDVQAIKDKIKAFFSLTGENGKRIGGSEYGVYAFFDYYQEPIYVGQTYERLSGRVSRHLTNQRTDAVAMNVLDPFEVAFIEVWPLDDVVQGMSNRDAKAWLDRAEYTVFQKVLSESTLGAVLNEKDMREQDLVNLPKSYKSCIIPEDLFSKRKHPDVRIARRASTIANLARVISERNVSSGLRRTLLTQAKRLESLTEARAKELGIKMDFE